MNLCIITCLILTIVSSEARGQDKPTDWILEREEKGIRISYRWIEVPGKPRVREMKADFLINASVPEIVEQFNNASKLEKWQTAVQKCNVRSLTDNQWETYIKFNLPWPFQSKDLVTRNKLFESEEFSVIESISTPDVISGVKNTNRIQSLESYWKMIPLKVGSTKIVHTSISYDKSEFPPLLADPIIQNRLIQTLGLLKKYSENE